MEYKKKLKTLIYKSISFDPNLIKRKLKNYEYVSFDIFDTLIKRDVNDIYDVFSLVESKYNRKYSDSVNGFKQVRIESERSAYSKIKGKEEVTLDDIYNIMTLYNDLKKEKLKELEIDTEIRLCTQHKKMFDLYQWCIQNDKKVILISDMYLDKTTLTSILERNGYEDYYRFYLSSEIGVKKSTGNLYKYVLKDLMIQPSKIVHIGDNIKSDYLMAKKNRIKTFLIPEKVTYLKFNVHNKNLEGKDKENYGQIKTFINNHMEDNWNDYFSFGYEVFGPVLLGFSSWLYNNLVSKNFNKVYFFSRDGYMLKKAFEQLFPKSAINAHYLYISRRSIRIPLLFKSASFESVIELVARKKYFNLYYFFKNIGLQIENYMDVIMKLGIDPELEISKEEFLSSGKHKNLFEKIKIDLSRMAENEYFNLTAYLKQEGFCKDIAVVDIGWSGSIQDYLTKLYPDLRVHGYYMGLNSDAYGKPNMQGYLFSPEQKNDPKSELYKSFIGLFEILFLALEGSTKNYKYDDVSGKYFPVKLKYEFDEGSKEVKKLQEIQDGAMKFIGDVRDSKISLQIFTSKAVYNDLFIIGRKPRYHYTKLFGEFIYYDTKKIFLAKPNSLFEYIFNLKKLKKDFYESAWKIGYLKKLFKFDFPYDKLYDLLKKIY
ncbi:HAD-IA family hydrolase [Heyndrickxia coagulans]|uniref:HAD family hydrolase n=1 Tax=Heyndrickxia coagulans TaxID=1398 RepID=UPI002DFE1852|nr:HAD-IA family hydrolase [Heyndrickxia coagulans]MEC5270230.1 HAD-IA family hydrolase [Heyndrickxia coagulans]